MMPAVALVVVLLLMVAELRRSRRNERTLRARGAREPAGDVYRIMTWAYPLIFFVMALEGVLRGTPRPSLVAGGAIVFALAKLLKFWAMASLGERWTFRVLVTDEPLVASGPYAYTRHPNYIAVLGEIVGFAALVGGLVTGFVSLAGFGELLRRRIAVEERALGEAGRPALTSNPHHRYPPCT